MVIAEPMNKTGAQTRWVFGYGSLIWNPGFPHLEAKLATLMGAHRSLCIYSHRHRGTEAVPGLVFGLLRGGSCRGMAFAVAETAWAEVYAYLLAREQDRGVYREAYRPLHFGGHEPVRGLAFVVNERHEQFAGQLSLVEQLRIVRQGMGESGANTAYVLNTARHLATLGIVDRNLVALVAALETDARV